MTDYLGVDINERSCSIDGCEEPQLSRGWCSKHYQRWWRFGDPLEVRYYTRPRVPCSVEGCEKSDYCKGMCRSHYQKFRRDNDPQHRAQLSADRKRWYEQNKAARLATIREYQKRNPEAQQLKYARRRLRAETDADLTTEQWLGIIASFGSCCAYCGAFVVSPEMEHVIPLSRGGRHTADNVVPACPPCNRHKGAMTANEFKARMAS